MSDTPSEPPGAQVHRHPASSVPSPPQHSQLTEVKDGFQCCGGTYQELEFGDNSRCCDGKIIDAETTACCTSGSSEAAYERDGSKACCDTSYLEKPANSLCCSGKFIVVPGEFDSPTCCGSDLIDQRIATCCEAKVSSWGVAIGASMDTRTRHVWLQMGSFATVVGRVRSGKRLKTGTLCKPLPTLPPTSQLRSLIRSPVYPLTATQEPRRPPMLR